VSAKKPPPPWLFVLTGMPYGVAGAFSTQVMPNLAKHAGIKLDEIGIFTAILFVPPCLAFLYAPLVDIGLSKRAWLLIVAAVGGAFLTGAMVTPLPEHVGVFLFLAFIAQLITGLVGACNGGLLAETMPDELRGRGSGMYNIGNLSGGALSAGIAIEMIGQNYEPLWIGLVLSAMTILPSFAVLAIAEPPREKQHSPREIFVKMLREVWQILSSRSGLTGIALCLSPVGTAALTNFFSAMGDPYAASDDMVAFVSGPANVVLTAMGALAGGYLCDRYNRRVIYLASGAATAAVGIVMALSPHTESTYLYGVMTYYLVTGFCYSAFTSFVLETMGPSPEAAGTRYSIFVACGNIAITYVGLVNTRFDETYGVDGVVASDATMNLAGVALLAFVFWKFGSFGKWRHAPAARS